MKLNRPILIRHILEKGKLPEKYFERIFAELNNDRSQILNLFGRENIIKLKEMPDVNTKILFIQELLSTHGQKRKVTNHIDSVCRFSDDELETLCDDLFADGYLSFTVFGCNDSRDIDVFVVVEENKCNNGLPPSLKKRSIEQITKELIEIGYDVTRGIDIVVCAVNEGRIVAISKGSAEICNVVLATYANHDQFYPVPELNAIEIKLFDKIVGLSGYILKHLEELVEDRVYAELRPSKCEAYHGGIDQIIEYSKNFIDWIDWFNPTKMGNAIWMDSMKSLVMKYCQLIIGHEKIPMEYVKKNIASAASTIIGPQYLDNLMFFLYRGECGSYSCEIIPILHGQYLKIIEQDSKTRQSSKFFIDISGINTEEFIFREILEAFLESPYKPSQRFVNLWERGAFADLNSLFILENFGNTELLRQIIGNDAFEQFIWVNQRSPEWLELLKYYKCGRNSGKINDTPEGALNIVRGAITEILVVKYFDFAQIIPHAEKYMTGFIVASNEMGANGAAPDLILLDLSKNMIIPVEIKCLKSAQGNNSYYRGMDLAQRQLTSIKNIIKSPVETGIVLLCHFNGNCIHIDCIMNHYE